MNELIWALLAIDVLDKIASVLGGSIIIIFVITGIVVLAYCIHMSVEYNSEGLLQKLIKGLKPVALLMAFLTTLYAVIPSKQTMHVALGLYAANQAAIYIADTDIGKQALTTLELKLKSIEQDLRQELEEQNNGKQ